MKYAGTVALLQNLDEALKTFAGKAVTFQDGEDINELSRKIALLNCLGAMKVATGLESIQVYALGTSLYQADELELDSDEWELLEKAIEQNVPGYVPFIQGQLLQYLQCSKQSE